MEEMKRFNVRVYGCLTHPDLGILTSVEKIQGRTYRKFPGGGLEGEKAYAIALSVNFWKNSICLFRPERISIRPTFFQRSAFRPNEQVISIYMEAIPDDGTKERLEDLQAIEKDHRAEWISLHNFHEDLFELPTDRAFVQLMKQQ